MQEKSSVVYNRFRKMFEWALRSAADWIQAAGLTYFQIQDGTIEDYTMREGDKPLPHI